MGTRADFYIKNNAKMNWLGSIGWDGYPEGIDKKLLKATDLQEFKTALTNFFINREDFTSHKEGWPWPWIDSNTTDYSYVYDVQQKQVFISAFGCPFFTLKENNRYEGIEKRYYKRLEEDPEYEGEEPDFDKFLSKIGRTETFSFPNMKDIQNVVLDGAASGLIMIKRRV